MMCVFCELLENGDAEWVVRDGEAVAFFPLTVGRLAPGHTSIVPALGATGVVVLNASGPSSGQSVAHLHFHLLPRWPDDGADLWPVDRSQHTVYGDVRALLSAELTT